MEQQAKLGFWSASSLVLGNMIGSGIFLLPASMAAFGWISLPAWGIAAIGALFLAFIFKSMAALYPELSGGPYAYTRVAFGEFPAYLIAWGYWISIWTTNAAIAVAFVSYLAVFLPVLYSHPIYPVLAGLCAVWFLTWLNTRKITVSGNLQLVTTIIKIVPLLAIGIYGLFFMNWEYFKVALPAESSGFSALTSAVTLALFAFLGLESATIPSGKITDSGKTIPRATLFGTSAAIVIYILSSAVLMGLIPPGELKSSSSPFADAAAILWGNPASYLVAIGALISAFGALNGWILMQGQIPAAAAEDGVFPKIFARKNRFGMPTSGLVISSILVSIMVGLNFADNFVNTFQFILLLSTLMALFPYLMTTAAFLLVLLRDPMKKDALKIGLTVLAFIFMVWAIIGSGIESMYWGLALLVAGIPGYFLVKQTND
ncbi:MAG: amino acid permease [Bacteroidota bacterium]